MEYQQGGQCYSTAKAAALAWASSQPIHDYSNSSAGCAWIGRATVAGTDDVPTVTWAWTRVMGSCATPASTVISYTATPCQLVDTADAQVMAWGVVAAWVAAYGIKFLAKGFNR